MGSWIYETFIEGFFMRIANELLSLFLQFLTDLLLGFNSLNAYFDYKPILNIIQAFAGAFLVIIVMFQGLKRLSGNYIFDGDSKPFGTIVLQTVFSGMLIYLLPFMLETLILPAFTLISQGVVSVGIPINDIPNTVNANLPLMSASLGLIGILLATIICGLCFLILGILSAIRYIELLIAVLISPIIAIQFVGKQGIVGTWFKEVVVICGTQTLHLILVQITMSLFITINFNIFVVLSLLIGLIVVAVKGPSILKNFIYSSGAGSAMTGAVGSSTQLITMRYLLTK